MHIYSKTEQVIFLLGIPSSKGTLVFPSNFKMNGQEYPGLLFSCNRQLPINPQLIDYAESFLNIKGLGLKIYIWQTYSDTFSFDHGSTATVYMAKLDAPTQSAPLGDEMKTMPQWLRLFPRDRSRLLYVRALQVFSGGLTQETKVVEIDKDDL